MYRTRKINRQINTLVWSSTYLVLTIIFIGKDLDIILDIGIVAGILLILTLLSTIISSCYIIIQNSRTWYEHLFSASVLHWIVFHEAKKWLVGYEFALIIPIISMIFVRIIHYFEQNHRFDFLESACWLLMVLNEAYPISYVLTILPLFIIYYRIVRNWRFILAAFIIPPAVPLMLCTSVVIIIIYGRKVGTTILEQYHNKTVDFITNVEPWDLDDPVSL